MKHLARLLREPLSHFLAIGGLFFVLFGVLSEPGPEPTDTIVVGPDRIEQLAVGFESVWRRPPNDNELQAMIDDFVREEIYYREALALGLDRNDTVVRRRLRQKMEFLTDSGADLLEPAAGELEAYFVANEQSFRRGPRLAFEQIFLGESPAPESIAAAMSTLNSDPATDPTEFTERTLLPARLGLSRPDAVDGVFGRGFFDLLTALPAEEWSGPVSSEYGVHLVWVTDSLPGSTPPLEDVRDAVLRDWKAAKGLEIRELLYARLRERVIVEIRGLDARKAGSG